MLSQFVLLLSLVSPLQSSSVTVQVALHQPVLKRPLCNPQNPGVPGFLQSIDVSPFKSCFATTTFAGPWSGAASPDGQFLYVSLSGYAGGFGVENCLVAKLDATTHQVLTTISVGLFPEEFVFKTLSGGAMEYGFVSNSSSGTVSVFDANDLVVATIALPDTQSFGTCYPFGMAISANQSRIYVGTLDGSGDVYAINTQTLSLVPSETINIPGGHGRLAFFNSTLIVPVTVYDPSFLFSTGEVVFVNPANPSGATTIVLPSTATYPSAQDVAVRCDGRAYVVGIDLNSEIFVFDAKQRTLLHTIPTSTSAGYHQGIALSSKGLLAVGDYSSGEIAFFNVWTEQLASFVDLNLLPGWFAQPTEMVFSKNGTSLLVPNNGSDSLAVFQIP